MKRLFEIYQKMSCFGAFLQKLSLHDVTKFASKSIKLTTFIEIIIENTLGKSLQRLQKEIHTSPSSPSLTYFQVQLFSRLITLSRLTWLTRKRKFDIAGRTNKHHRFHFNYTIFHYCLIFSNLFSKFAIRNIDDKKLVKNATRAAMWYFKPSDAGVVIIKA